MVPPAPGRFSMTICCPRLIAMRCEIARARMSVAPAGGKATIRRIGFDG
jgi:hypothetical protein